MLRRTFICKVHLHIKQTVFQLKKHKRNVAYTFYLVCITALINIMNYLYILHEQKYRNLLMLETHHALIKELIFDNLGVLQIINDDKLSFSKQVLFVQNYIKNYIFVPKSSIYVDQQSDKLVSINLQDLLNKLSRQVFNYAIFLNDKQIINKSFITFYTSLTKKYQITKNLFCSISIQINPNSFYVQETRNRMVNQVIIFAIISCIILSLAIMVVFLSLSKDRRMKMRLEQLNITLADVVERNRNILLFSEKNKEFILKCYQYSKDSPKNVLSTKLLTELVDKKDNKCSEYLPIPLILTGINESLFDEFQFYKIELQPIILELTDYFKGYVAYYNTKTILSLSSTVETISMPFEQEVFNQVIVSIFCNILHFNKDTKNVKYIMLEFQHNKIVYSSNGFRLDHNLVIRYSEKIFNDTGNLYLLNLGQVFILLKKYKLDYLVTVNKQGTTIEVKLNEAESTGSNKKAKIINLSKFKNKRELND